MSLHLMIYAINFRTINSTVTVLSLFMILGTLDYHRCWDWFISLCWWAVRERWWGMKRCWLWWVLGFWWETGVRITLEYKAKTTHTTMSIGLKFHSKIPWFWTLLTLWYALFLPCTPAYFFIFQHIIGSTTFFIFMVYILVNFSPPLMHLERDEFILYIFTPLVMVIYQPYSLQKIV
jgi:hypothetical protein